MDKKKDLYVEIKDERTRRITFKKRRIGILKKAIQLSLLSGSVIELKVYNEKDKSFVEYYSHSKNQFEGLTKDSNEVLEYAQFFNFHANLLQEIDERVNKHGNTVGNTNQPESLDDDFHKSLLKQLENKNLMSLFSLAKQKLQVDDHEKTKQAILGKRLRNQQQPFGIEFLDGKTQQIDSDGSAQKCQQDKRQKLKLLSQNLQQQIGQTNAQLTCNQIYQNNPQNLVQVSLHPDSLQQDKPQVITQQGLQHRVLSDQELRPMAQQSQYFQIQPEVQTSQPQYIQMSQLQQFQMHQNQIQRQLTTQVKQMPLNNHPGQFNQTFIKQDGVFAEMQPVMFAQPQNQKVVNNTQYQLALGQNRGFKKLGAFKLITQKSNELIYGQQIAQYGNNQQVSQISQTKNTQYVAQSNFQQ